MRYIGSKEKLNDWLFSIILSDVKSDNLTFLDACSGSGSVSRYAATHFNFKKILSNDIMEFPSHIVRGSIALPESKLKQAQQMINEMNALPETAGFFYENYSEHAKKLYFSNENAKKIDACRKYVNDLENKDQYINSYLLYCLLDALSKVSNTTGIQAAFLKTMQNAAKKPLTIKALPSLHRCQLLKTFNNDILKLLNSNELRNYFKEDILYIDPPYNERQYGSNYHLYETLVKNDNPKVFGKTGLRDWKNESKSDFCSKKTCLSFTENIVKATEAKTVYISYSSDGLLSLDDFKSVFKNKMTVYEKDQKRYKSDDKNNRKYNEKELKEYLIKIER